MAKRDAGPEPMQEDFVESESAPVGERLKIAREEKGLSLEDVAAQTRIPQRHLASIETSDWEHLPAATYTIGFAKSYAGAVGLDRMEIGNQLREEMGGQRFANTSTDVFEAADPARTMPKWLVLGAIAVVVVIIALMSWLNNRSLEQPEPSATSTPAPATSTPSTAAPRPAPALPRAAAQGPVVLSATAPVWLQVSEKGGSTLFSGMLQPGQSYSVPPTATAPVLKTGKPEALQVMVGSQIAPPVGAAAKTVSNVSLLPADLMKGGAPASSAAAPSAPRAAGTSNIPGSAPASRTEGAPATNIGE